jgi:hypothetical protein
MKVATKKLAVSALTLLMVNSIAAGQKTVVELDVGPFAANYSVEYRGIKAGSLDFVLRKQNDGYVYESIAHPRGVAKLFINNNLREASEFVVEDGRIKPQTYELDDGSAATKDDTRLQLNWNEGRATGRHENKPVQLPLTHGVQDRMSAQVVIMRSLISNNLPEKLTFIDRDELKEYSYSRLREEKLQTALGEIDTVVIASSRPGSNRVARLWYAPSLGYIPVRGEQERKGKIETVFQIQTLRR